MFPAKVGTRTMLGDDGMVQVTHRADSFVQIPQIPQVIYLDTDLMLTGPIEDMWEISMDGKIFATPEFCQFRLSPYFMGRMWSDPKLFPPGTSREKRVWGLNKICVGARQCMRVSPVVIPGDVILDVNTNNCNA